MHLDAGYDDQPCRQALADRGLRGEIATRGARTMVVAFWLLLALALIVVGRLLRCAWTCYRWEGRARRRP